MPKEVAEIKEFIKKVRDVNAKQLTIKGNKKNESVKFKLKSGSKLYTFKCPDHIRAARLKRSLPPGLQIKEMTMKA